eukprot:2265477-Pyramimonas_sp.AAC.1
MTRGRFAGYAWAARVASACGPQSVWHAHGRDVGDTCEVTGRHLGGTLETPRRYVDGGTLK